MILPEGFYSVFNIFLMHDKKNYEEEIQNLFVNVNCQETYNAHLKKKLLVLKKYIYLNSSKEIFFFKQIIIFLNSNKPFLRQINSYLFKKNISLLLIK